MYVLDVNLSEPLESDILTFASKQELNDLLTRYLYEFVEAKLPQPEVEIVGYDKIGRELWDLQPPKFVVEWAVVIIF